MFKLSSIFVLVCFLFTSFASIALADAGDKKVTLSGKVKNGESVVITPKTLSEMMGTEKFEVLNPWEKKNAIYEGVLLDEFVKLFGSDDVKELKFTAIDEYEVNFDMDFLKKYRILLATKENGEY
ncbi:MAG: hypothetical protein ACLFQJ_09050, partial [Campylobacterales bacterium]